MSRYIIIEGSEVSYSMFDNNEFMNYMGYRNNVIEEIITECLGQVRAGETEISIDKGDLSDDEIEYLKREVRKRV